MWPVTGGTKARQGNSEKPAAPTTAAAAAAVSVPVSTATATAPHVVSFSLRYQINFTIINSNVIKRSV